MQKILILGTHPMGGNYLNRRIAAIIPALFVMQKNENHLNINKGETEETVT